MPYIIYLLQLNILPRPHGAYLLKLQLCHRPHRSWLQTLLLFSAQICRYMAFLLEHMWIFGVVSESLSFPDSSMSTFGVVWHGHTHSLTRLRTRACTHTGFHGTLKVINAIAYNELGYNIKRDKTDIYSGIRNIKYVLTVHIERHRVWEVKLAETVFATLNYR